MTEEENTDQEIETHELKAALYFIPTTIVSGILISAPIALHDFFMVDIAKEAGMALEPLFPSLAGVIFLGSFFIGLMGSFITSFNGEFFYRTVVREVFLNGDEER